MSTPPLAAPRTVTVSSEGRVPIAPDVAYVLLGVETSDATLAQAQRENAGRMAALRDRLAALGLSRRW